MPNAETPVELARRHVTEGEQRVARQKTIVERLVKDGHEPRAVDKARLVLRTLEHSLRLAKEHLEIELSHSSDEAPPSPGSC